ncbi:hypothetical protein HDU93_008830, partial [Gonapodya sp. JEL0774]
MVCEGNSTASAGSQMEAEKQETAKEEGQNSLCILMDKTSAKRMLHLTDSDIATLVSLAGTSQLSDASFPRAVTYQRYRLFVNRYGAYRFSHE